MNSRTMKIAAPLILAGIVLAGCSNQPSSTSADQSQTDKQLKQFQQVQPSPYSDWSQYRQTIIDVENAQIHGTATTSFFFNQGTDNPIKSCSSIGFPVATTSQLTNPEQLVQGGSAGSGTIGQQEPNGVYTGDSSGTYVVCISKEGTPYITYWEGYVQTEGGPAHWDKAQGQIVDEGHPSVIATKK